MTDAVETDGLRVTLGDRDVLQDITFRLPSGSMLAVLGPNGSGKSTLLRTFVGLVEPSGGSFRILGCASGELPCGAVGYVPQIKSLDRVFPARAVDLVLTASLGRWPGRISRASRMLAEAALDRVGVRHLADRSIGALSGGELQRIYLARAVSRDPAVLLLDEPEAGVDAVGTADLHSMLDRYRADHGTTIVLVTHDWDAAQFHATHVLLLRGRQVAFGPTGEAFTEEQLRRAFGHVGHAHPARHDGPVP
jgi:zinc transport system ATP-binding protein